MDIIAKLMERETRKIQEYAEFVVDTNIGKLSIVLKEYPIPHAGFRYIVSVNKGITSESKPFLTRFFANKYFEKMKKKYGGEKEK